MNPFVYMVAFETQVFRVGQSFSSPRPAGCTSSRISWVRNRGFLDAHHVAIPLPPSSHSSEISGGTGFQQLLTDPEFHEVQLGCLLIDQLIQDPLLSTGSACVRFSWKEIPYSAWPPSTLALSIRIIGDADHLSQYLDVFCSKIMVPMFKARASPVESQSIVIHLLMVQVIHAAR